MTPNCPYCNVKHPNGSRWHIPLTIEEGIIIQNNHLREWKDILKPSLYKTVERVVTEENSEAGCGHDICRGNSIDEIVANLRLAMKQGNHKRTVKPKDN